MHSPCQQNNSRYIMNSLCRRWRS